MSKRAMMMLDISELSLTDTLELEYFIKEVNIPFETYEFDSDISVVCDERRDKIHSALIELADKYEQREMEYLNESDKYDPWEEKDQVDDLVAKAREEEKRKEYYERLMDYLTPLEL